MSAEAKTIFGSSSFAALRRFAPRAMPGEQCDLCSLRIGEQHHHLLEVNSRKVICSCDACSILFPDQSAGRYKQIPRRAKLLNDFQLTDIEWESFGIPIGLAFFFYESESGGSPTVREGGVAEVALPDGRASDTTVAAFYPSPAGATECLLDLSAWQDLLVANPILNQMQPDVEALLVNRIGQARDYYLAPIDECYKLVGIIRTQWRGLSGGRDVWATIDEFFRSMSRNSAAAR